MDYLNYGKQVQKKPQGFAQEFVPQKPQQILQSKVELTMDDFNFGDLTEPEFKDFGEENNKVQSSSWEQTKQEQPSPLLKSKPPTPLRPTVKFNTEVKKDEVISIFPVPVVITSYPNDFEKELEWIKTREYKEPNDKNVFQTNRKQSKDSFILDNLEMVNIRKFIQSKIDNFTLEILGSSTKLVITQSWLNFNFKNESLHEHTHPNSMISGVWYPQIDKELPPIMFASDKQPQTLLPLNGYNSFNGATVFFPMNKGEMILFPSWLRHGVPTNTKNNVRISLSFNTWAKGDLGDKETLTYLPLDRCV